MDTTTAGHQHRTSSWMLGRDVKVWVETSSSSLASEFPRHLINPIYEVGNRAIQPERAAHDIGYRGIVRSSSFNPSDEAHRQSGSAAQLRPRNLLSFPELPHHYPQRPRHHRSWIFLVGFLEQ